MSTKTLPTQEDCAAEASIDGPIPEFDHNDAYTGYDYFRCSGCGVEAMRRRDVRAECECGGV